MHNHLALKWDELLDNAAGSKPINDIVSKENGFRHDIEFRECFFCLANSYVQLTRH